MAKNAPQDNETAVFASPSRDELRAQIFSAHNKVVDKKTVDFFGQKIELRQPTLADINSLKEDGDNNKSAVVQTLIRYAYMPGTEEKVFEDSDYDSFMSMPFGKDFTQVMEAFGELTGIDFRRRTD